MDKLGHRLLSTIRRLSFIGGIDQKALYFYCMSHDYYYIPDERNYGLRNSIQFKSIINGLLEMCRQKLTTSSRHTGHIGTPSENSGPVFHRSQSYSGQGFVCCHVSVLVFRLQRVAFCLLSRERTRIQTITRSLQILQLALILCLASNRLTKYCTDDL